MVTIKVIHQSSGDPWKDKRVGIIFDGWAGGSTGEEYTNNSGEAHFDRAKPGSGQVYVDGRSVFKGRIEGRTIVYA